MQLQGNFNTILYLQEVANASPVALTLNGADLRFIDITHDEITEVQRWAVRDAEADVAISSADDLANTITLTNTAEASLFRRGETVELFNNTIFLGTVNIVDIDEATGIITYADTTVSSPDVTVATKFTLRADPFMLDGFTKPMDTASFKYMVVKASANCELGVERIQRGNYI